MSLAIHTDRVCQVLLADGWHDVEPESFYLDAYEILAPGEDGEVLLGGGQDPNVPSGGASWIEKDGSRVSCPITSILATRERLSENAGRR